MDFLNPPSSFVWEKIDHRFNGLERWIDALALSRPRTEVIEGFQDRLRKVEEKVFAN